jgi:FkbM family methyltransferase
MGQYSARLRRLVGPTGRVIGFEASKPTYLQSRRILRSPNVDVHNLAVGAAEGEVVMGRYANEFGVTNHGISRVISPTDAAASERETVRCVSLDDFLADRQRPIALVKCDVEGYEPQVFDGAANLIAADKPVFLAEIQDPDNFRHVTNRLAPHDYRIYQLNGSGRWQPLQEYDQRWTINFLFVPASRNID